MGEYDNNVFRNLTADNFSISVSYEDGLDSIKDNSDSWTSSALSHNISTITVNSPDSSGIYYYDNINGIFGNSKDLDNYTNQELIDECYKRGILCTSTWTLSTLSSLSNDELKYRKNKRNFLI